MSDGGGLAVGGRWAVSGEQPGTTGKSRWPVAVLCNRHLPQSALGRKTPLLRASKGWHQIKPEQLLKRSCDLPECDTCTTPGDTPSPQPQARSVEVKSAGRVGGQEHRVAHRVVVLTE